LTPVNNASPVPFVIPDKPRSGAIRDPAAPRRRRNTGPGDPNQIGPVRAPDRFALARAAGFRVFAALRPE